MAVSDYPFCVYCDNKVCDVRIAESLIVYRCAYCGHEVGVIDERLL